MVRLDTVATGGAAVTPSDTTEVGFTSLYIGGAGNVAVKMQDGQSVTFSSVPAGTFLPVAVCRVLATGTTATGIVGLK